MDSAAFEASPAWSKLDDLQERLDRLDLDDTSDDERQAARSLESVVEFVRLYEGVEPSLVEASRLQELVNALDQILNHVDRFLANRDGNRAHLQASADQVPNVVAAVLRHFPGPAQNEVTAGMRASMTRFRNQADEAIASLVQDAARLREELAQMRDQRAEDVAAAESALTELQAALNEHTERFAGLNVEFETQMAAQASALESARQATETASQEAEAARDERQQSQLNKLKVAAENAQDIQLAKAEQILDELRRHEEAAKAILDSTSKHAVSGEYGSWAEHQGRAAFGWTVAAVLIGIGVVLGLILAMTSAADDSIQFVTYKISVGFLAAAVAAYAGRQAAEHRAQERRFKRLALDVAAIEPFLARLDDPADIRKAFAERVFASSEEPDGDSANAQQFLSFSVSEFVDVLKAAKS